jgi:uncharacterized protein
MIDQKLVQYRAELGMLCQRHGVLRLFVYGSAARGERKPASDFDFSAQFMPADALTTGRNHMELYLELEDLLGEEVSLVDERFLKNPYFAQELHRTKVMLYELAPVQAAS